MIDQGSLTEITQEYINHMQGEKIDFKALMPNMDRSRPAFEVQGNTAIIPLKGVMTPGASFFSFFFDGVSTKNVQKNIQAAIDSAEIDRIIIDVNSGGGSVEGAFELADFIEEAGQIKEIIAFSDGTIASAAYLAVSGASKIYITGKSNQVGSIGVIARRLDFSKMNEMDGLSVNEFVTGQYKNSLSSDKPLTESDSTEIQSMVDKNFVPMVADIAARRGLDPQQIIDMQGRIFIGAESIEVGLVDGVSTLNELINNEAGAPNLNLNQQAIMDQNELKAKHPELFEAISTDAYRRGADSVGADVEASARSKERERISGIQAAAFPGQEELAAEMIADGKTSPGEAAIRFNAAEKQARLDAGKKIAAEMPEPIMQDEPEVKPKEEKKPEAKTPDQEFEASKELQAEFGDLETYKAYLTNLEAGNVRIFQGEDK
jgi:signal peptide peptidase SppA